VSPAFTEITEGQILLALLGKQIFSVTEKLTMVGAALSLYAISRPNKPVTIRLRELQPPHWKPIASILNVGVPAAMESLYWQLATVVITGIIVQFGEISLAAHQLGLNAESLSYMPSNGFGIAATAFVGQSLGARKPEQARRYIAEILKWGVYLTIVTASMLMFMPGVLMGLLTGDPEVIRLGSIYLRLMALVQLPQIISGVLGGAMRGGGDVRAPMVISGIGIWVFRIPLAFMFTRVLHMNVVGVWVAMTIDLFVRVSLNLYRFRQGKWHSRPVGIDV
jgi:putative MATE family efflux protein